jgi:O-antigen ligase
MMPERNTVTLAGKGDTPLAAHGQAPGRTRKAAPPLLELFFGIMLVVGVGRVGELVPGLARLPLAKMVMAVCVFLVVRKWKELAKLTPPVISLCRTATALVVLAIFTTPFSILPGATVSFILQNVVVVVVSMIVCYKASPTWRSLRMVLRALVIAAVALAVTALLASHGSRADASRSYDPNDLAYLFVSVLPVALGFVLTAKTTWGRAVNIAVFGVVALATLLTGSRGGFLGLLVCATLLVGLPIRRPAVKPDRKSQRYRSGGAVFAVLAAFAACAFVWFEVPQATRDRLDSVFSLQSDYNLDTSNDNGRLSIWERNFVAGLKRPLGFGLNSFDLVDARTGGVYRAPHNSYLQIFVELGVVGFILFIRMYWLSLRLLQSSRRTLLGAAPAEENSDMLIFARMLQVGLLANAVSAFFLSMAYSPVVWLLFAASMACGSLAAQAAGGPVVTSKRRGRASVTRVEHSLKN